MNGAHVLTVVEAGADDRAGRDVARALSGAGVLVVSRQVVDPSEAAVEAALRGALETRGGLTVVLANPGGSEGELVPRVVGRLTGARLALNERRLALIEASFSQRGLAMPRRLDRLAKFQPAAGTAERQGSLLLLFRPVLLLLVRVAHLDPIPCSRCTRRVSAGVAPRSTTAPERKPAIFSASASSRPSSRPLPSATCTT